MSDRTETNPSEVTTAAPAEVTDLGAADVESAFSRRRFEADPRTVIITLLIINALAFGASAPLVSCSVVALAVIALATARPRYGLAALGVSILCTALTLLPEVWLNPVSVYIGVIGFWCVRFTATVAFALYALLTIRVSVLVASLRAARCPRFVVIPLTVVFRMFPTIMREARAVRDAMTLRGLHPDPMSFATHPIRTSEMLIVPLLTSVLRSGDELTAAALVRGLGRPERPSSVIDLRFGLPDALLAAASLSLIAMALATGGWVR